MFLNTIFWEPETNARKSLTGFWRHASDFSRGNFMNNYNENTDRYPRKYGNRI